MRLVILLLLGVLNLLNCGRNAPPQSEISELIAYNQKGIHRFFWAVDQKGLLHLVQCSENLEQFERRTRKELQDLLEKSPEPSLEPRPTKESQESNEPSFEELLERLAAEAAEEEQTKDTKSVDQPAKEVSPDEESKPERVIETELSQGSEQKPLRELVDLSDFLLRDCEVVPDQFTASLHPEKLTSVQTTQVITKDSQNAPNERSKKNIADYAFRGFQVVISVAVIDVLIRLLHRIDGSGRSGGVLEFLWEGTQDNLRKLNNAWSQVANDKFGDTRRFVKSNVVDPIFKGVRAVFFFDPELTEKTANLINRKGNRLIEAEQWLTIKAEAYRDYLQRMNRFSGQISGLKIFEIPDDDPRVLKMARKVDFYSYIEFERYLRSFGEQPTFDEAIKAIGIYFGKDTAGVVEKQLIKDGQDVYQLLPENYIKSSPYENMFIGQSGKHSRRISKKIAQEGLGNVKTLEVHSLVDDIMKDGQVARNYAKSRPKWRVLLPVIVSLAAWGIVMKVGYDWIQHMSSGKDLKIAAKQYVDGIQIALNEVNTKLKNGSIAKDWNESVDLRNKTTVASFVIEPLAKAFNGQIGEPVLLDSSEVSELRQTLSQLKQRFALSVDNYELTILTNSSP